jgi:multiple antibiotic resistance protein
MELFFAVLASLFSVVNPMGAVPVFLAMTPNYTVQERTKAAMHTSLWFVVILSVFFFAGTSILSFFGISLNAMRIAGGLVILSSGYALLSGKFAESRAINKKVKEEALEKHDISFSPITGVIPNFSFWNDSCFFFPYPGITPNIGSN